MMRKKKLSAIAIVLLSLLGAMPFHAVALEKGPSEGEVRTWEKPLSEVYSEPQRKAIFRKIGVAEDKAAAEVKPVYESGKAEEAVKLQQKLQRKYVMEVLERYGITPAQELELYTEALEKQWAAD
jgi:hypothetical protein